MKKRLSKRNDPVRRRAAFWRHTWFAVSVVLMSLVIVAVWLALRRAGIHCGEEDAKTMSERVADSWVLFGVPAAFFLTGVWKKYTRTGLSILQSDKQTFMLYRDQHLPIVLQVFLGTLSLVIMAKTMLLGFESEWIGGLEVFSTAFMLIMFWKVLFYLENPLRSQWYAERVDKSWLEEDVDVHFGLEEAMVVEEQPIKVETRGAYRPIFAFLRLVRLGATGITK